MILRRSPAKAEKHATSSASKTRVEMSDSANVVTGFEFPRVNSLGESAEAPMRGNFVACHHFCQASKPSTTGS
jgi:hypothetical protein